jgi:hypothetical protein
VDVPQQQHQPPPQPGFATTVDVLELIVGALGLPHVGSLLRMRAVSRAWQQATHNGVRRVAMHPDQQWSTADTMCDFAAATPRVARAVVVAGGEAWLGVLPDQETFMPRPALDAALRHLPRLTALYLRPAAGRTAGPRSRVAELGEQLQTVVDRSTCCSPTATARGRAPLRRLSVDATLGGADASAFLAPVSAACAIRPEHLELAVADDHEALGAALTRLVGVVTRVSVDIGANGTAVLPTTAQALKALADAVPGGLRRLDYGRRAIVARDPGLIPVIKASPGLEGFSIRHVRARGVSHLSALAASCPNLRALCLERCPTETSDGLRAVARSCTNLESVECIQLHGDDAGDAVVACVQSCRKLHTLTIVEIELSKTQAAGIARHAELLKRLHVSVCGKHSAAMLVDVARTCGPRLQDLTVDGIHASDRLLSALGAHCTNLRAFKTLARLGNAQVTDAGLDALTASDAVRRSLQHLSITNHRGTVTDTGHALIARRCHRLEHYCADSGVFPFHPETTIEGALRAFACHGSVFLRRLELDVFDGNGIKSGVVPQPFFAEVVQLLRSQCPGLAAAAR